MILRREYKPGADLFAQVPLRFAGVEYVRGDKLPTVSRAKHRALFLAGKASHLRFGLFDRRGRLRRPTSAVEQPAPVDSTPAAPRRAKRKR